MRILFCGARTAGYQCLKYLLEQGEEIAGVLTIDDSAGPKWAESVIELAKNKRLKIFTHESTKDPKFIQSVSEVNPEALFSVYYDKVIPLEILKLAKWNINIHGGKLPEYRGSFSNIWAIINGESKTAATAHVMEEKLDSGNILEVKEVKISDDETGKSLYFKVSDAATELFKDVYRKLKKGSLSGTPQPQGGKYYKRQLPNEGIIDWSWPPKRIHDFIRALNFPPFMPARTVIGGRTAYVYGSKLENEKIVLTDVRLDKK